MFKGARKLPTQHITIRVPWHDAGWNGTVCRNICANTSCVVLPRIAQSRDDALEIKLAGQSIEHLERAQLPPCVEEHATFMAGFKQTLKKVHPYRASAKQTHGHFEDTSYHLEPYAAAAVPFRWMLKNEVEGAKKGVAGKAEQLSLGYMVEREPDMSVNGWDQSDTSWVQHGDNQRMLLDTFFSAVQPEESLVFFYAKRTPLSDQPGRVIVGVGRVKQVGAPTEYRYAKDAPGDAMPGYLWERNVHHSIRTAGKDGFLLPYHQLLELAEQDDSVDLESCVAYAPAEAFEQYSYGSELLTQDNAIASLLACEKALKVIRGLIEGPWDSYLVWIDGELNRLWQIRGAYPGFGAALKAFGISHGNLLAWHLAEASSKDEMVDPWPRFQAALENPSTLPSYLQESVGPTWAKKWQQLLAERKALLQLLSRFVLSDDQATRWYQKEQREKTGITITDREILANPYVIFEADRTQEQPIAFTVIDRGMFPPLPIREAAPLPDPSRIVEDIDPRRVRAAMISVLEAATVEGHTFLPAGWLVQRVQTLALQPACPLDADALPIFDDQLAPQVELLSEEGIERGYQLQRYALSRERIAAKVLKRLRGQLPGDHDWSALVDAAIEGAIPVDQWDELEKGAREEKAEALKMMFRSRVSVLMGAAGTGKSTLIKALCRVSGVQAGGVLLLAPTGKARVRLEQASGMPGKGLTIAQFLHGLKRYDGRTGRYFVNPDGPHSTGQKTVVIDESSMLTEDQLAALIDGLAGVERLIFVGDPKQLPPIGAGRPFVDIVNKLRPEEAERLMPRVAPGFAELLITRRQQGERLDLQFANYFSGAESDPGQDDIWTQLRASDSKHIRLVPWSTPEQLLPKLLAVVKEELKLRDTSEQVDFSCSLGGSLFNDYAYFWPRKGDSPGAASKAEAWQILSPLRLSQAGSDAINRSIQAHFRAGALEMASTAKGWNRKINKPMGTQSVIWGDKVINVINSARRDTWPALDSPYVANGDIGIVTGAYKTQNKKLFNHLEVEFSSQQGAVFKYKPWEFDGEKGNSPLELAYALTVHKTQGSEFGITFLVIPNPCLLLSREMLYTAITRQRDKVVIFLQGDIASLHQYSLDSFSEVKRRLTNLFQRSVPTEVEVGKKPQFLDQNLIYRTRRSELVRSKTEWIIADKLDEAGITYHYELPLDMGGVTRYPDFTIKDDDSGVTCYWEHLGLMNRPQYVERWRRKEAAYRAMSVVPATEFEYGKSSGVLITTEEDGERRDLSEQIEAAIDLCRKGFF
jgi:ATP-dependent exoDNAse (exonuclease V) alpha subunit